MDISEVKICIYNRVRKTSRRLAKYFNYAIKPLNLKGTQFMVLSSIYNNPKSTITQLSLNLELERTTVTRSLTPLIKQGLVLSTNSDVGNFKTITLTKKGEIILEKAFKLWKQQHDILKSKLTENEFDQLFYLLDKINSI